MLLFCQAVFSYPALICIVAADMGPQQVPDSLTCHGSFFVELALSLQSLLLFLFPFLLCFLLFLCWRGSNLEVQRPYYPLQRNFLHLLKLLFLPGLDVPDQLDVPVCRHVSISPLEVEPSKRFPLLQGLVILGSRRMDVLLDIDLVAPSTEEFMFDSLKTLTDLLLAVINSENLFNRRSWNYCKAL